MPNVLGKLATPFKHIHLIRGVRAHKAVVGRVVLVILALLVCAIPVVFINNAIAYIPLIAAVLLVILSYVYLRILMRSLTYSEDSLLDSCERGSEIEFVVNFENKSPLVFLRLEPYFYIGDVYGDTEALMPASMVLMPFEKRDFHFDASFDHIGTYGAGVKKIVISDLLGLFSHTIENPNRHEVKVLPKIFDIANISLSNVSVQESRKAFKPIVTDDMDYAGVREYEPGDPLKTIHWKLSSRNTQDEYYTRLFETFGNPGVSIILDDTAPEYDHESLMEIFDGVVESALSVNDYARKNGIDSELIYLNRYNEVTKMNLLDIQDADQLIDDMQRIKVAGGRLSRELFTREGGSLHAQGNVVFCTAHVNEEIISALIEVKRHQRNPLLFVVMPKALEGDARRAFLKPLRRLQAARITYYAVSSAEDLAEETI